MSDRDDSLIEKKSVSVIIPVYNSREVLPKLISALHKVLNGICNEFEVILIDDDSHDKSWEVIRKLSADNSWIRGIQLMRNYGQHNALLCGIREARFEIIVTMDDDLQHPPEEIPSLINKIAEGYDVVYGTPHVERHSLLRFFSSKITKIALQTVMGAETARHASAFRAFRAQVRDAFAGYMNPFISIDVLLTWGTTRFTAIPVRHEARTVGVSNYTLKKLITHALNMMTGFSILPLQFASFIGFIFTLFGLVVLAYVVGRYILEGASVPGFPFLASIIVIFSGAQLLAIGIIGEYLARMHVRTMGRPPSIVREYIGFIPGDACNINLVKRSLGEE